MRKRINYTFKMHLCYPENDNFAIDDLIVIDRPMKEIYEAIKQELLQLGAAIGDCCAEGLAQTFSINEIITANLIKWHGLKATDKAKDRYLLVKDTKSA